jgi:hypothetical protein
MKPGKEVPSVEYRRKIKGTANFKGSDAGRAG